MIYIVSEGRMGAKEQSSQVDYSSKQMDIPHSWNYPGVGQAACWEGPPPSEAGHHHGEGHRDGPAFCEVQTNR